MADQERSKLGWEHDMSVAKSGMLALGSSAPLKDPLEKLGFTQETGFEATKEQLAQAREMAA